MEKVLIDAILYPGAMIYVLQRFQTLSFSLSTLDSSTIGIRLETEPGMTIRVVSMFEVPSHDRTRGR